MALLSRGRKKRLILDIGTSAIRLCELAQTKSGYQLVKYYQQDYNSDPSLEEEAKRDLRKQTLQELLKQAKVRNRKTIFAVPGQSVFTRTRALPPVPEYKVNQIVKYEIQQQIPFALDQIAMSYQVLNRTEAGGYEVMMAAIKVDVVDKHLDVLDSAKRVVDVVDVSPLAAYNWLKHTGEFGDQGECVALIDLGATTTDIVIERDNQFRFTRPLNVGGNDITQSIATGFGMSFVEAEKLKRERGFAPTGDPQRDGKGGEVIGQALGRLVGEIMRSFAYFRSLPGGGPISRVILTGGGAAMRNLVPYMQRQLGVEVRIAQPLAGIAVAPGAQQVSDRPEQASVVLGLALRSWQPVTIEINLIPPRVLERARRKEQAFYWALSLATLALIMASIIPVSANENKLVQQRISTLKQAIGMYDPSLPNQIRPGNPAPASSFKQELGQLKGTIGSLQKEVETLDEARQGRRFWVTELEFINSARPTTGGMWFSGIETTRFIPSDGSATPGAGGVPGMLAPPSDEDDIDRKRSRSRARRGGGGGSSQGGAYGTQRASLTPGAVSTGFPGLGDMGGGFGGGGGGVAGGGMRRVIDDDEGSAPAPMPVATPNGEPPAPEYPEQNGFILNGFSESPELIHQFIDNMKQQNVQLPNGQWLRVAEIDFNENIVQRIDRSILYQAPTDLEMLSTAQIPVTNYNPGSSVYSFVLHIRFVRSLDKGGPALPEAPLPAGAAGAAVGGAGAMGLGAPGMQPLIMRSEER